MAEHAGDLLSALLDGELTADEAIAVCGHVGACAACATELQDVRDARRLLRELPAVEPPFGFLDTLGRRHRRAPVLAAASIAAAAAIAVAVIAPWQDASPDGTDIEVALEHHDSTVEALENEGVLEAAPERLESGFTATPTTAKRQERAELDEVFDAPAQLDAYELVAIYDAPDGIHLLYRRGPYALSVFEREGEIDFADLPDGGTSMRIGDHRAWRWDDHTDGRVLVIDADGVVYTVACDEPGDVVLDIARALVSD